MSTDFSGLKLCLPNGGCTSDHEVQIDKAKSWHSGNYTCHLDSLTKSTSVQVTNPPSSVSVAVLNLVCRKRLVDATVQFTSSSSWPLPEHRCSVAAEWTRVQNLTHLLTTHWLIVAALQKSIDDGRTVSQWRLVTELIGSPPKVTCSAVQILPNGMAFERICSNSALISCPADDLKSLTSNCAIFAALFSVAGFVLGCILCGILWALSHLNTGRGAADEWLTFRWAKAEVQRTMKDVPRLAAEREISGQYKLEMPIGMKSTLNDTERQHILLIVKLLQ
uniref:Ig-like domain-containing protein n=1 Tax=Macrostomum lignano TaxID=282301 RepID=A0A1I8IA97_9PLAT